MAQEYPSAAKRSREKDEKEEERAVDFALIFCRLAAFEKEQENRSGGNDHSRRTDRKDK